MRNIEVKCPTCGSRCLIKGKTTMHYEPIAEAQLDKLTVEGVAEIVEAGIKGMVANELLPYSVSGASREIAQAVVKSIKGEA